MQTTLGTTTRQTPQQDKAWSQHSPEIAKRTVSSNLTKKPTTAAMVRPICRPDLLIMLVLLIPNYILGGLSLLILVLSSLDKIQVK